MRAPAQAPLPPEPVKLPRYCTVMPTRRQLQKSHLTLGHAKQAVLMQMRYDYRLREQVTAAGQVYELVDGEWALLYDIAPGMREGELPWRQGAGE